MRKHPKLFRTADYIQSLPTQPKWVEHHLNDLRQCSQTYKNHSKAIRQATRKIMKPVTSFTLYSTIPKIAWLLVSKMFHLHHLPLTWYDETNRLSYRWKELEHVETVETTGQGKRPHTSERISPTPSRCALVMNTTPQSTPSTIQTWSQVYVYLFIYI